VSKLRIFLNFQAEIIKPLFGARHLHAVWKKVLPRVFHQLLLCDKVHFLQNHRMINICKTLAWEISKWKDNANKAINQAAGYCSKKPI